MKKKETILIGTHNDGKLKEISKLINKKFNTISPVSLKIKSPKETGKTFKSNSELKANYFYKKSKIVSLSDDSGLEIISLNKRPGIYSARWSGKHGDFKKAIKKVYKELKKKKIDLEKNIKARFIRALSISYLNKKIACVIGKVEGRISKIPKGKNGFGYDPIFIPNGNKKTFGQMKFNQKYKLDHRFNAFKKIKKFL